MSHAGTKYPELHEDAIPGDGVGSKFYAVHPDGHVVTLPAGNKLKPGWRLAEAEDIERSHDLEEARQRPPVADEADIEIVETADPEPTPPAASSQPPAPPTDTDHH